MNACLHITDPSTGETHVLDVVNIEGVGFRYAVADVIKENAPTAFFSDTIQIAGSDRVNNLLNHVYRVDRIDSNIIGSTLDALLTINDVDILKGTGRLTLETILWDSEQCLIYEFSLVGTRNLWIANLDKELCSVDFETFTYSEQMVIESQDRFNFLGNGAFDWDNHHVAFYPVHYGRWLDPEQIQFGDLSPHIYIKWLVHKLFEECTDYEVVSNFYWTSEEFEGYHWNYTMGGVLNNYPNPKPTYNISTLSQQAITLQNPFPQLDIPLIFATTADHGINQTWDVRGINNAVGGVYYVEVNVGVIENFGNLAPNMRVYVEINGNVDQSFTYNFTGNIGTTQRFTAIFEEICLEDGDDLYFRFAIENTAGQNVQVQISNTIQGYIRPSNFCTGLEYNIADLLPCGYTGKDLIDALTIIDNLIWETDDTTKTIRVDRAEDYYVGPEEQEDWSGKLDCLTAISQASYSSKLAGTYNFQYQRDRQDAYIEYLEGGSKYRWFSGQIKVNPQKTNVKSITVPIFAPTTHIWDYNVSGTASTPIWLRMWNEIDSVGGYQQLNDNYYKFVPRISYYAGLQQLDNGAGTFRGYVFEGQQLDYQPYAYMVDSHDGGLYSLAFNSGNYWPSGPQRDIGKIERHWQDQYYRLLQEGRVLEALFILDELDIHNLSFQKPKYISHPFLGCNLYRLLEVEWEPYEYYAAVKLLSLQNRSE